MSFFFVIDNLNDASHSIPSACIERSRNEESSKYSESRIKRIKGFHRLDCQNQDLKDFKDSQDGL